jgi:hypothetical protein
VAPTEMQTLILWALLAKPGGASFQKDLIPEVKKPDRDALVGAGLITADKPDRRRWRLEITETGWAWAGDHLDADLPKRSNAGSAVLQAWLKQLKHFMTTKDFALADILRPQLPNKDPPHAELEFASLRERVRRAYLNVTGGRFNARALLKDVREKLKDIKRDAQDEALARMHLEEGTTLSGLNNPQEITQEIRDAGLSFKGEPMYVLWITR